MSDDRKQDSPRSSRSESKLTQSTRNDELLADYFGELFSTSGAASKAAPPTTSELPKSLEETQSSELPETTAFDPVQMVVSAHEQGADGLPLNDGLSESQADQGEEFSAPLSDHSGPNEQESRGSSCEAKPVSKAKLIRGDELLKRSQQRPFKEGPREKPPRVVSGLMPKMKAAAVEPKAEVTMQVPVKEPLAITDETLASLKTDLKQELKTDLQHDIKKELKTELKPELKTELKSELKSNIKEELKTEISSEVTSRVEKQLKEEFESQVASLDASIAQAVAHQPPQVPPGSPPKLKRFRELDAFEALIFEVRGLQLAVPLISLGSIHRLDDEITPIFGRADWYLGMYRANDRNLQVVDTARWVMPTRGIEPSEAEYDFVIRLGDTNWGLACNAVHQSMRIRQSEVKWRTENSKRPWLAGTVIAKMCALLDVDNMAELLEQDKLQSAG